MLWFNRSVGAQFDYDRAYRAFLWASRPRWGGSYELMLEFGMKCLETKRLETVVPGYYLKTLTTIGRELPGYNWRMVFRDKEEDAKLGEFFDGMAKARPEDAKKMEAMRAICKLYTGRYGEAAELLQKVDRSLKPAELFAPYDSSEFLKRDWDALDAEARLFTGPCKDILAKAETERFAGKDQEAVKSYVEALQMAKNDPAAKKFILKETGFLLLDTKSEHENEHRTNPIHQAALKERLDVIKFLLENGESVNALNDLEWTPLHYAAKTNEGLDVIKFLLEKGADINSHGEDGWTPLAMATSDNKNIEAFKFLLEKNADISKKLKDGESILSLAFNKDPSGEKALSLLEKTGPGYDYNSADRKGWTALHLAARYCSNTEAVKKLLDKGARLDLVKEDKATPFTLSIYNRNEEVAKLLMERGADINHKNMDGLSALYIAVDYGRDSLAKELLEKGADVNVGDKENRTILHIAICRKNKNLDIIKGLLARGANPNVRQTGGWSPFMCALAYIDNPEIIRLMLEKGANVNEKMEGNISALNQSIHFGTLNNFKCLIENGAGINDADCDNWSPLYRSAMMGRKEMVSILLEKGAKLDTKCHGGKTALDVAANTEIKELLLAHGAKSGSAQ